MQDHIEFVRSRDGTRIATAVAGSGRLLIKAANWLTHIERDRRSPVWAHWIDALSQGRRLLRYDERGTGLSERDVEDLCFERMVEDLEAVADHAGDRTFDLIGISQGGAVAIEYASRHPERVGKLILYGAYAQGWNRRDTAVIRRRSAALADLIRLGWVGASDAYLELFAALHIPGASADEVAAFVDACRSTTSPETAARLFESFGDIDVRHRLERLAMPTLVAHCRFEEAVPFEQGRLLAAGIRKARFLPLESRSHVLMASDPAWPQFAAALNTFLTAEGATAPLTKWDLTSREIDVLKYLVRGDSNATIGEKLGLKEKSVRNYLTIIFEKLGVASRSQAIVLARDVGIGTGG